jgi:hypothetical protein
VVLSLTLYGLAAGTVGGVVAARLMGYPGSPVVAPARDVPRGSDAVFGRVSGIAVEQTLTKAGYECDGPAGSAASTRSVLCRDRQAAGYERSLTLGFRADGGVTSLTGRCRPASGTATLDGCGAFIGGVPGVLYPANAAGAKAARNWATGNFGADTSTVIDGVYYAMQLEPLLIVCMPAV